MNQCIRIIGGIHRGKKIFFPALEGLRPTPDRVRETLFNWLMHDIRGTRCLDAFAGSGALGFEAFSRGASSVTFVEQSQATWQYVHRTCKNFPTSSLAAVHMDTLSYLQQCTARFDLIFLDPPFAQNLILPCLELIHQRKLVQPGGLIYLESASPITLDQPIWLTLKQKKAGAVHFSLVQYQQE